MICCNDVIIKTKLFVEKKGKKDMVFIMCKLNLDESSNENIKTLIQQMNEQRNIVVYIEVCCR
jgi:hypothetical protein